MVTMTAAEIAAEHKRLTEAMPHLPTFSPGTVSGFIRFFVLDNGLLRVRCGSYDRSVEVDIVPSELPELLSALVALYPIDEKGQP